MNRMIGAFFAVYTIFVILLLTWLCSGGGTTP